SPPARDEDGAGDRLRPVCGGPADGARGGRRRRAGAGGVGGVGGVGGEWLPGWGAVADVVGRGGSVAASEARGTTSAASRDCAVFPGARSAKMRSYSGHCSSRALAVPCLSPPLPPAAAASTLSSPPPSDGCSTASRWVSFPS